MGLVLVAELVPDDGTWQTAGKGRAAWAGLAYVPTLTLYHLMAWNGTDLAPDSWVRWKVLRPTCRGDLSLGGRG